MEGLQLEDELPPSGLASEVRGRSPPRDALNTLNKAKKDECLAAKAETLTSEFAEIKDLLLNLQPGRGAPTREDSPQARAPAPLEWDEDALSTIPVASSVRKGLDRKE